MFLVGCSKNEVAENNNIVENQQQNESVDNIEKEENSDFSDKIAAARAEIENITSIGGYGVDYTSIKQNGEKYLLKIAFSKYIDSSDPEYPVFDESDNKIVEIELNAEDKIVVANSWILLDGSNQEMQAGEITVAEILDVTQTETAVIINSEKKVFDETENVPNGTWIATLYNGFVVDKMQICIKGDVNCDGKITAADARLVLRHSAKLEKLNGLMMQSEAADIDYTNGITAADARLILRKAAGLE